MRELFIGGRRIADDQPCYVIAEIGSNHQGDRRLAERMIEQAEEAGAEAVKFQKRDNAHLYTPEMLAKDYDNEQSFGSTYGEHRDRLELDEGELYRLSVSTRSGGTHFIATPFDETSADVLERVGVDAFKIASGALTDHALIKHICRKKRPVILSTGGGTIEDIDAAVRVALDETHDLAVLHCTAAYPAEFEDLNLRCIETLRRRYPKLVIGWSCHIHNLSMLMVAYALGARILEVHFTLNRAMKGTDNAFSLEPATLRKLCKDLGRAHVALGDGVKRWVESEKGPISKMRRVPTASGLQITGRLSTSSTWTASSATPTDETT